MDLAITGEPVMISALEHYAYCPRQCALIHVEHVWDENIYTSRGRDVHERVDEASSHAHDGIRMERALPLWSKRLNLVGKADVVEFLEGMPFPVEYKSGRRRKGESEALQLCAQGMCLEEMFGVRVDKGALYWHGSRERKEVVFTDDLRHRVEAVAGEIHAMIAERHLPPPVNDQRCQNCSLKDSCMPHVVGKDSKICKADRELFEIT